MTRANATMAALHAVQGLQQRLSPVASHFAASRRLLSHRRRGLRLAASRSSMSRIGPTGDWRGAGENRFQGLRRVGGAASRAIAGAVVGSAVPVVGTAVGAVVGGLVGLALSLQETSEETREARIGIPGGASARLLGGFGREPSSSPSTGKRARLGGSAFGRGRADFGAQRQIAVGALSQQQEATLRRRGPTRDTPDVSVTMSSPDRFASYWVSRAAASFPGTGDTDGVLSLLTPGERVVPKAQAQVDRSAPPGFNPQAMQAFAASGARLNTGRHRKTLRIYFRL